MGLPSWEGQNSLSITIPRRELFFGNDYDVKPAPLMKLAWKFLVSLCSQGGSFLIGHFKRLPFSDSSFGGALEPESSISYIWREAFRERRGVGLGLA